MPSISMIADLAGRVRFLSLGGGFEYGIYIWTYSTYIYLIKKCLKIKNECVYYVKQINQIS